MPLALTQENFLVFLTCFESVLLADSDVHKHGDGYGYGALSRGISPKSICSFSVQLVHTAQKRGQRSVPKWLQYPFLGLDLVPRQGISHKTCFSLSRIESKDGLVAGPIGVSLVIEWDGPEELGNTLGTFMRSKLTLDCIYWWEFVRTKSWRHYVITSFCTIATSQCCVCWILKRQKK